MQKLSSTLLPNSLVGCTTVQERTWMARLIPNEEPERLPEDLYDELEEIDCASDEDEIDYLLGTTNLTAEEAEEAVAQHRSDMYDA